MFVSMRRLTTSTAMFAVALAAAGASAQQAEPRDATARQRANQNQSDQNRSQDAESSQTGQNRREQRSGQRQSGNESAQSSENSRSGQPGQLDGQLAACLIIGNQKEIAVSRLGGQQGQSEEVKAFGKQMVEEHQQFITKLEQFATQGGFSAQQLSVEGGAASRPSDRSTANESTSRNQSEGDSTTRQRTTQPRESATAGATERQSARAGALDENELGSDLLAIEREVAQQCVQSTQQALGEKQGAEFDKAFMTVQVMEHMGMVDKLEVFSRHASPELQAVLQEGLQTAQQHLEHAKQLHKQLEGQAGAEGQQQRQQGQQPKS